MKVLSIVGSTLVKTLQRKPVTHLYKDKLYIVVESMFILRRNENCFAIILVHFKKKLRTYKSRAQGQRKLYFFLGKEHSSIGLLQ